MVDTSVTPSLGYMEVVPDRTAQTLLPIIRNHVHQGTEIWSDQWRAYSQVSTISGVSSHQTVNHSLHFKDPQTGVHTNNIESYWNRVKIKFKNMKGVSKTTLASHLDEFMWRERYSKTSSDALNNLCSHMAACYPHPRDMVLLTTYL